MGKNKIIKFGDFDAKTFRKKMDKILRNSGIKIYDPTKYENKKEKIK